MAAIATSLIGYTVKAIIFAALAYAGIICGKKFRDKKEADRAKERQQNPAAACMQCGQRQ